MAKKPKTSTNITTPIQKIELVKITRGSTFTIKIYSLIS